MMLDQIMDVTNESVNLVINNTTYKLAIFSETLDVFKQDTRVVSEYMNNLDEKYKANHLILQLMSRKLQTYETETEKNNQLIAKQEQELKELHKSNQKQIEIRNRLQTEIDKLKEEIQSIENKESNFLELQLQMELGKLATRAEFVYREPVEGYIKGNKVGNIKRFQFKDEHENVTEDLWQLLSKVVEEDFK